MSQNVIAAQMYTVRDFTKTLEGFSDSVAKIAQSVTRRHKYRQLARSQRRTSRRFATITVLRL